MLIPLLSFYSLFTGEGGSNQGGRKPREAARKVRKSNTPHLNLSQDVDGVWRSASAFKERADHATFVAAKEKEELKRKKTKTMKDMHILDYQALR